MLFYGPPGTGKTLAAKRLARTSGLDYAIMSGGDVAPLGPRAVTSIHQLFDWAGTTSKGVLLFIDEADAFLSARKAHGEDVRAALNALLFRTGAPSRDIALVLATNRPGDLDEAVLDRVDEALEFGLPSQAERAQLLRLYFSKYILQPAGTDSDPDVAASQSVLSRIFRRRPTPPNVKVAEDVTDSLMDDVARQTEGFSGRELAKLMASVQAAVYGRTDALVLDAATLQAVVAQKIAEHKYKLKLQESSEVR
jgi:ATPase family AAA domain-containing protein 3A/B